MSAMHWTPGEPIYRPSEYDTPLWTPRKAPQMATDLTRVTEDDWLLDQLATGHRPDTDDPAVGLLADWRDQQTRRDGDPS